MQESYCGSYNKMLEVLQMIDDWWSQGETPLSPGALLGEDDRSIRQTIADVVKRAK